MPVKINGLPAHVLLIHVVIVLIPLAGVMVIASAVWPAARARLGVLTPVVALVALITVPITTHAGEWLQDHLQGGEGQANPLIRRHADLGDQLLPWAIGLFVVAAAVWLLGRRFELAWTSRPAVNGRADHADGRPIPDGAGVTATLTRPQSRRQVLPVWATALVAVVAVTVSVGSVVELYRIGDSGAKAAWDGRTAG